jgi:hypothetical protein
MPRAYSVQFGNVNSTVGNQAFYVPAGKRAVLRSISLVNLQGLAGWCSISISGFYAWAHYFQATDHYSHTDMRQVAYAGQTIAMNVDNHGFQLACSGYLFDDDGLSAPPPYVASLPANEPEWDPPWGPIPPWTE